jgi:hypothetical protein
MVDASCAKNALADDIFLMAAPITSGAARL